MLSGCGFFHSFLKCSFHKRLPQRGVCLLFYLWVGCRRQSSPMGQPLVLERQDVLTKSPASFYCLSLQYPHFCGSVMEGLFWTMLPIWSHQLEVCMDEQSDGWNFDKRIFLHCVSFVIIGFHDTEESKTLGPWAKCAITELYLQLFLLFGFE